MTDLPPIPTEPIGESFRWRDFLFQMKDRCDLIQGVTVTVPLAALTVAGRNGYLVFNSGVLVDFVSPT